MESSHNIGTREISFVAINLLLYRIFSRFPIIFPKTSGNAATLSALYSGIIVFAVLSIIVLRFRNQKEQGLIELSNLAFGTIGKTLVTILILIYMSVSAIVSAGEFVGIAKQIAFPTSPVWFILAFFVIGATLGAWGSSKTACRLHSIFMPIVLSVILILVVSTIFRGEVSNLLPPLGLGAENLFGKGLSGIIMYTDIILLFLIPPKNSSSNNSKLSNLIPLGIGIFATVLFVFAFNLVVSYPVSVEENYPMYLLMKEVYYGRFFQRIDAIILLVAALSGMLYLALNIRLFSNVLCQIFKLSKQNIVILIYSCAIFVFALFIKLIPVQILSGLVFILGFILLGIVFFTAIFSRKGTSCDEKI